MRRALTIALIAGCGLIVVGVIQASNSTIERTYTGETFDAARPAEFADAGGFFLQASRMPSMIVREFDGRMIGVTGVVDKQEAWRNEIKLVLRIPSDPRGMNANLEPESAGFARANSLVGKRVKLACRVLGSNEDGAGYLPYLNQCQVVR